MKNKKELGYILAQITTSLSGIILLLFIIFQSAKRIYQTGSPTEGVGLFIKDLIFFRNISIAILIISIITLVVLIVMNKNRKKRK